MIAVPPFRGEFGLLVRYHVPAVHALARPLVVCHEPGLEALYPNCGRIVVDCRADVERRDLYAKDEAYVSHWTERLRRDYPGCEVVAPDRSREYPERRFVPVPYCISPDFHSCDVVICPRRREYGAEKNWPHWHELSLRLRSVGVTTFAAGSEAASDTSVPADVAAWQFGRELDATIQAMGSAQLVIATDAGLAHLAVLCGAPLLIVGAAGGRPAPGPVSNERGKIVKPRYWPIRMDRYYHAANHTASLIEMMPYGWENPDDVADRVLDLIAMQRAG